MQPQQISLLTAAALAVGFSAGHARLPEDELAARIEEVRANAGVPAIGAALITGDGLQEVWVTGVRRAGSEERVTVDDLWHLGSCTKAMTATLVALLVTRGDLEWDTALGELLPNAAEEMTSTTWTSRSSIY